MQLFYLLSFVVVVSHAAALPQPAELSDKYSSNVDITLASFLEARSYQPELNSHKDSATLTSLERRDDSDGGSDLPPLLSYGDIQNIISKVFRDEDFSSANMATTIDRAGGGVHHLFYNGEDAGKAVAYPAGDMLERYLSRFVYVIVALGEWIRREQNTIFRAIKSALGDKEYYRIIRELVDKCIALAAKAARKEDEAARGIFNIVARIGTDIHNVETIGKSFGEAFDSRIEFFDRLRYSLKDFEATKILYDEISNVITSVNEFIEEQQRIYNAIIGILENPQLEW